MAEAIDRRIARLFTKALTGLVLTSSARETLARKAAEPPAIGQGPSWTQAALSLLASPPPPAALPTSHPTQAARPARPEKPRVEKHRTELLRDAMAVYAEKQAVFDELDPAVRTRLRHLAGALLLRSPQSAAAASPTQAGPAPLPAQTRAAPPRSSPRRAEALVTAERMALIQQAMVARSSGKQQMLSGLDDEARAQLVAMSILTFIDPAAKKS